MAEIESGLSRSLTRRDIALLCPDCGRPFTNPKFAIICAVCSGAKGASRGRQNQLMTAKIQRLKDQLERIAENKARDGVRDNLYQVAVSHAREMEIKSQVLQQRLNENGDESNSTFGLHNSSHRTEKASLKPQLATYQADEAAKKKVK